MRDFRDAKAMARTLRGALAEQGLPISNSQSLELIAKLFALNDWNTLSAKIQAARPARPAEPPPPPKLEPPAGLLGFSPSLQQALHQAVTAANQRHHEFATLEHLLAALAKDEQAAKVMAACGVDAALLEQEVTGYLDTELKHLTSDEWEARPTEGFQRVIRRAVVHVQASGRPEVSGPDVLVAMFSERESHAVYFLARQGMSRLDAVNFIVHGIRKSAA